jgi:putative membrane protein
MGRSGIGRFIIRWIANAVAIWVAFRYVPGITPLGQGVEFIVLTALVFGLVNAVIGPILKILALPFIILTLGLATLVINAALFALAGWVGTQFGVGFVTEGFWPAFWGALVVTIVSAILSSILGGDGKDHRDE